jgi:DNA-binding MarR family transcriptional regulator
LFFEKLYGDKVVSEKKSKDERFLSKAEYESLSNFRFTVRQFLKFSETAAEAVGLTPNQHQALLAIKGFPGRDSITNGELAERLQIKHHSAVGLINRLEAQNLVSRKQGSGDRREVYVRLTKPGEKLLEQLTAAHREELKRLAPQLTVILKSLDRRT